MANEPTFVTIGSAMDKINVRLSYRIIELFSEGLYASPNKAVEELVANSGRVVYGKPDLGMGIAFTMIEPEDQRMLERWISELASQK